ncbi:MAG: AAA family ATPase, partial [Hyphomicrobiaceae bacterium]
MWVWDWLVSLSSEAKGLLVTTAGLLIKWVMDRRFIAQLRREIARKEAALEEKEKRLERAESDLKVAEAKIDGLKQALRKSESGIWTTYLRRPPFDDFDVRIGRGKPTILTVANNKGGVGKTTLVGNLLAYFERKRGKRVLAIDMDYQGSLSTLLQRHAGPVPPGSVDVNRLLQDGADVATLLTIMHGLGAELPDSQYVSAFYDLALSEDRILVDWLL